MTKLTHQVTIEIDLPEMMRTFQRQHGTNSLVAAIVEYCCDTPPADGFEFEDKLVAAVTKFKEDNQ